MKANPTYLLDSLSNNDVTFFIPPYQRNYEWSVENCRVLLTDVHKVARLNESSVKTEHFFGSIVYVVEESGFGLPDKYVLTDGQQRITTTMLLLMALRDSLEDSGYQEAIQKRYLENERAGDGSEYKIKLKQVETDWEAYKCLALRHEIPSSLKNSTVYQNYLFFHREFELLNDVVKKGLLEKGLRKFSTISIQLEPDRNPWENPQEIFESMNSLGKPLSLADLVRNYLLMGQNSDEQTKLYNEYWLTLEKRLPGKLSEFIRDWMQSDQHKSYKVARESNYKELYGMFKKVASGRTVEELFEDFVRYSRPYAIACGLDQTKIQAADHVIFDLNIIGVAPAYSYLTEVLAAWSAKELTDGRLVKVLLAIRTYLLRRRVLGMTQAENKFFPVLGARIADLVSSENLTESLFEQLSSQEYALRLPNDSELSSRLETMNFYNLGRSRNYPRLLLSLAEELLTKSRPAWDDNTLQLEHIMPQKLSAEWSNALGESYEKDHQDFVNNIGNITLIRHNQELGNKPYVAKKVTYAGKSGLQVTQNYVLDRDEWNVESIQRRQQYLVGLLVEQVLEIPHGFKQASNWKQNNGGSGQFDSRQILNQLAGETIQFVSNPKITATVLKNSKVLFEGQEWNLSPLTAELKDRDGTVSKSKSYQGALYWSWDDTRLVDIDI
ncbi:DUF262 domain-containing protein [Glutamicibacter ardleyensis]|uniref:DUF262 domain-containing protein n=1 Tax=Glutamicibacter ardleyensis TaxID=225894 RepID=A0ABQ2DMD8_9MICC|nr:DUF262 domain-containing protein [Glutamicibacter ardleyensis]GGJ61871.1 hypothetical protein GCM10007173_20920 [Glutamicibacter ardleyensis]